MRQSYAFLVVVNGQDGDDIQDLVQAFREEVTDAARKMEQDPQKPDIYVAPAVRTNKDT